MGSKSLEEAMEERKSMGSALVEVFDAGVVLVKSEINAVTKKVSELAKAKGVGIVLVLAALGPLVLGLIFLILAVFYGLMRLGLAAWAAALIIALVSLAITGALIVMGLKKLSAEVDTGMPRRPVDLNGPEFKGATASAGAGKSGVPATSLKYDVPGAGAAASVPATTFYGDAQPGAQTQGSQRVYESDVDGRAKMYGDRLNEKLEGHGHDHDPNLQNPVVLRDAPGIAVSTTPTYIEDMRREGLDVPDTATKGGN